MFEYARRDRNDAGYVCGSTSRARLNVSKMRSGVGFGPQTKKENIDRALRLKRFQISDESVFQATRVCLHRSEALDLFEKGFAQQPFKVSHETECIVPAHRRQRILSENIQAT